MEKYFLSFKLISHDENYLKFNISLTLGLKITISPPRNLTLAIPRFWPNFFKSFSFDFIEFWMNFLFNIQ
jgi:hypothetical protein